MPYTSAVRHDALARVLDEPGMPCPPDLRGLLRVSQAVSALPDPDIDPAFVNRLGHMLLTASIDSAARVINLAEHAHGLRPGNQNASWSPQAEAAHVIAFPRRKFVVHKVVAAALAAAMLVALPIIASAKALPGTPLYGLRTALERLEYLTADGPVSKGFVDLRIAEYRLDDVNQLLALGDTRQVPPTLAAMDSLLSAGTTLIVSNTRDVSTLRRLASDLESSTGDLTTLLRQAPAFVKRAIINSLNTNNALSKVVNSALGLAVAPTAPAVPGSTTPNSNAKPAGGVSEGPAAPGVNVTTSYADTGSAGYVATPAQTGGYTQTSQDTQASCVSNMYAGPDHGQANGVCQAAVSAANATPPACVSNCPANSRTLLVVAPTSEPQSSVNAESASSTGVPSNSSSTQPSSSSQQQAPQLSSTENTSQGSSNSSSQQSSTTPTQSSTGSTQKSAGSAGSQASGSTSNSDFQHGHGNSGASATGKQNSEHPGNSRDARNSADVTSNSGNAKRNAGR
ncbi:MAG: DUF5667 domain-containing protein [Actinomycetota bacterium]